MKACGRLRRSGRRSGGLRSCEVEDLVIMMRILKGGGFVGLNDTTTYEECIVCLLGTD